MSWVVNVPPDETSRVEFSRETEAVAHAALNQHGCALLRGAFSPAAIEGMHRDYLAQFGALDEGAMAAAASKPPPNRFLEVGNARFDILLRMTGAFARPDIFANLRLLKLLRPLLGGEMHLSNFTAVVAHPGAAQQHPHRDHHHLFAEPRIGPSLPIYSINVAVPLIDVELEMGPTGVWLGSHRWDPDRMPKAEPLQAVPLRRGDCMLLDYRTMHAGLANRTSRPRPIVYMVYARPWFFDQSNHLRRIPIDMPLDLFEQFPGLRPLLSRALSYAVMRTWGEDGADGAVAPCTAAPVAAVAEAGAERAEVTALAAGGGAPAPAPSPDLPPRAAEAAGNLGDVSGRGKIGRNDPCPCGSGKKYKQCHGGFGVQVR
jgi:hypothetical protein